VDVDDDVEEVTVVVGPDPGRRLLILVEDDNDDSRCRCNNDRLTTDEETTISDEEEKEFIFFVYRICVCVLDEYHTSSYPTNKDTVIPVSILLNLLGGRRMIYNNTQGGFKVVNKSILKVCLFHYY